MSAKVVVFFVFGSLLAPFWTHLGHPLEPKCPKVPPKEGLQKTLKNYSQKVTIMTPKGTQIQTKSRQNPELFGIFLASRASLGPRTPFLKVFRPFLKVFERVLHANYYFLTTRSLYLLAFAVQ